MTCIYKQLYRVKARFESSSSSIATCEPVKAGLSAAAACTQGSRPDVETESSRWVKSGYAVRGD